MLDKKPLCLISTEIVYSILFVSNDILSGIIRYFISESGINNGLSEEHALLKERMNESTKVHTKVQKKERTKEQKNKEQKNKIMKERNNEITK